MKYSHKLFIAGGKSKGVFDSVVWHLDNGAELVSSEAGNSQIVYILRRLVSDFRINEIKRGKAVIGWEVVEVKPMAFSALSTEFEFEDDAKAFVKERKESVWNSPVEMEMPEPPTFDRSELNVLADAIKENIDGWEYESKGEEMTDYQYGLNAGLKYAKEEIDKVIPPLPDDSKS